MRLSESLRVVQEQMACGGRRTLLTNLARRCAQAGASLRDVQQIAGHADLGTTERYVEPSLEAQRRLIALT